MSEYILELRGITKLFPGVKALDNVDFKLKPGEIHALMGENGAGKSTLIKVITGVHIPDEGDIIIDGKKVSFKSPRDASHLGVAAIYQHVTSFPHLTVTENIFMGRQKVKMGIIGWRAMHKEAQELLQALDAEFNSTDLMGSLSVAQQQMVEIAKALSTNARIVIMDEPTAALTRGEAARLYEIAEKLRDDGVAIIFISHRFEDMYRLASRVTVFRDAGYIWTKNVSDVSENDLIHGMVGRELDELFPKLDLVIGEEVLRVENISSTGIYKDVSFKVNKGEILGVTGLVGAGRTEVMETLFGINRYYAGNIYLDGEKVTIRSPGEAMRRGIGLLTEDRQHKGLILDWGLGRNITLAELKKFSYRGVIDEKAERTQAKELAERVDTRAKTLFDTAGSLSGGNQQKLVVARALTSDLKVLIMDEPTKGVDVGAKAAIYEVMGELASQGMAIIMVSSEMPEILGMCDRIYVMCEGRVTGELSRADATGEKILELAMKKGANHTEKTEMEDAG
ncbi:MAG: sugar ABC transporter ATP-binding protein [Oscillospiraceae bacterium]|nr:sugar ABC transporter ATP-binding protein [Oscillospiraceae bacterium]